MDNARIKLLFFGITHDIAGSTEMEWQISPSQTVGDLRKQLQVNYPKFRELKSFAIAVNEEYAAEDNILHAMDEVAIIPPVSGG